MLKNSPQTFYIGVGRFGMQTHVLSEHTNKAIPIKDAATMRCLRRNIIDVNHNQSSSGNMHWRSILLVCNYIGYVLFTNSVWVNSIFSKPPTNQAV